MRFPGFQEDWEVKKLGELLEFKNGINASKEQYGKGVKFINVLDILNNDFITYANIVGKVDVDSNIIEKFSVQYGDVLFQRSSETREEVGTANVYLDEQKNATFGGFVIRGRKIGDYEPTFFNNLLKTDSARESITTKSGGSTRFNVGQEVLSSIALYFPSLLEQGKISNFLSHLDKRLSTQKKIIEVLKTFKVQTRKKLLVKIIKEDYEPLLVKEILNYEQPTKYIVLNTDYSDDKALIPVLTANKSFILGYADGNFGVYDKGNCIILDDFTMDLKYVNFPFKVKSSAIKILTAKDGINLKFVFEYFSFLNFSSNEHKRHYISEIEKMSIVLPKTEVQNNIARFLTVLDEKINLEIDLLSQYELQKKYLLSNLFV